VSKPTAKNKKKHEMKRDRYKKWFKGASKKQRRDRTKAVQFRVRRGNG